MHAPTMGVKYKNHLFYTIFCGVLQEYKEILFALSWGNVTILRILCIYFVKIKCV